nr:phenylalanine--tRNA ligase beta subunit-related protein [Planosporangium thailandense]
MVAGEWRPLGEADPAVASWHEAYRLFGTNPRRSRCSLDALSRRLAKSGTLPRVHPAVDAYNLISVSYGTPAGAFDLDRLDGEDREVVIRFARPGDRFTPLGQPDDVEEPAAGEVVYADGNRVLTRHWNHRDCDQTKVTGSTTAAVFMLERVSAAAVPDDRMAQAQEALAALLAPHAATVSLAVMDADRRVVTLDDHHHRRAGQVTGESDSAGAV